MYEIYNSDELFLYMTKTDTEAIHYVDALADNEHISSYIIDNETNKVVYERNVGGRPCVR